MDIRGVPFHEVTRITAVVSENLYGGNVMVDRFARDLATRNGGFRGRIIVRDSSGQGSRRSSSGRRGPYACWHVFRDVLFAIFEAYPDAVVSTSVARYKGRTDFLDTYPGTRNHPVGSRAVPGTLGERCECDGNVPETAAENRARFESAIRGRTFGLTADEFVAQSVMGEDSHDPAYDSPDAMVWTADDKVWLDTIGLTSRD